MLNRRGSGNIEQPHLWGSFWTTCAKLLYLKMAAGNTMLDCLLKFLHSWHWQPPLQLLPPPPLCRTVSIFDQIFHFVSGVGIFTKHAHVDPPHWTGWVCQVFKNCGIHWTLKLSSISCKFGHQIQSSGGATCIVSKVGHKVAQLTLPHIVLDCPIGIISYYWVSIFISQSHIS